MHDRKNLLALIKLALQGVMIGQQPHHVGIAAEGRRLARAQIGVDLAAGQKLAQRSAAAILLDGDGAEKRQRVRVAVAAAAFDRALHPMDRTQVDAELMLQMPAQPDRGGLGVERQPDPAAFEVFRRADA